MTRTGRGLALRVGALLVLVSCAAIGPARALNPARIRGTVTGADGSPVVGATIRFEPAQAGRTPRTATTDKKGAYRLPFIEFGRYVATLEAEGLAVESFEFEEKGPAPQLDEPLAGRLPPGEPIPELNLQPSHEYRLDLVLVSAEEQRRLRLEVLRSEAAREVQEASRLLQEGRLEESLEEADRILARDPESGYALYVRGMALLRMGRGGEARPALERAAELIPEQPGVRFGLGTLKLEAADGLADTGQEEAARGLRLEAAADLEKELELSPGAPEVLTNLALAYYRGESWERAAGAFEALIEARPDDLNAYFALSDVYNRLERPEEAMQVLDRLPEAGPEAAVGFFNVAVNLMNEDRPGPAIVALQRALQADEGHARSHRLLGMAYLQTGKTDEALAAMRRFLELAPDDDEAESTRALVEYLESKGEGG